jgi:diguanylate cyclase (GGDEF)-like protein
MDRSFFKTLLGFALPGGALLVAVAGLASAGVLPLARAPLREFFFYSVFAAGAMLALRFRSARVLVALLALFLAGVAMRPVDEAAALGAAGVAAIAFLLPVNLAAAAFARERGFSLPALGGWLGLLLAQSAAVLLLGRPEHGAVAGLFQFDLLPHSWLAWTSVPQMGLLAFIAALALLLGLFLLYKDPVHASLAWTALAAILAVRAGAGQGMALVYLAAGGLALAAALIESGYRLAYHDELTLLPARRAFNEALLRLDPPYAIAVVDVDHFKRFNDTFGHDTGDQVLKMVARRLAEVGGDGEPFRVGGEEFAVVFPGRTAAEASEFLEEMRQSIQHSSFTVRAADRRAAPRPAAEQERRARADRRAALRPAARKTPTRGQSREAFVTVSIGVAGPAPGWEPPQVIRAADQALYAAKRAGRNRVQVAVRRRSRQKEPVAVL